MFPRALKAASGLGGQTRPSGRLASRQQNLLAALTRLGRGFSKSNIGIVGAGPCGLILGLLLDSLGEKEFQVYDSKDQNAIINSHPAAHYINAKTFELLRPIEGLEGRIRAAGENLDRYRYYRYVREIGGLTFQVTDQLKQEDLSLLKEYTTKMPAHMPQNVLQRVLLEEYDRRGISDKLKLGTQVTNLQITDPRGVSLKWTQQKSTGPRQEQVNQTEHEWLVLADGFRSKLRANFTNITMIGRECKVESGLTQSLADLLEHSLRKSEACQGY